MDSFRMPWKSWVVVCDGAKALILQNEGDAELLNLKVVETLSQPDEKTSDLGTDKPGRAHSPPGTAHSAMEQTDWHAQAETAFLKDVASKIAEIVDQRDASRIVLVAPPAALGILRPALSASAGNAITAEVAKDYTKMQVADIEKHLLKLAA